MKVEEDPIALPRKLLTTFGFWRGRKSGFSSIFVGVALHLLFVDIYLTLQLIYIFKLNDVAELSNLLKMCLTYVALFAKSINFVMKFGRIEELEKNLEGVETCNWQRRSDDKSKPSANRIRRIFYALWISSLLTIFLGAVAVVSNRQERRLPDKMWIPFDYLQSELRFLLVAFYQLFGASYACTINTALDVYLLFVLSALTASVEDLGRQLSAAGTHGDLKAAVKKHRKIRENFNRVDFIFKPIVTVQVGCSAVVLCTTAFSLSKVWQKKIKRNISIFLCIGRIRTTMFYFQSVLQFFLENLKF